LAISVFTPERDGLAEPPLPPVTIATLPCSENLSNIDIAKAYERLTRNALAMAWAEITQPKYQRDGLHHASDTVEAGWPRSNRRQSAAGAMGETNLGDVFAAIFTSPYQAPRRLLPRNFSPPLPAPS
jgi:hypothetical protein